MKLEKLISDAKKGDAPSQYSIGMLYGYGTPLTPDFSEAIFWFEKAREQDHAEAIYNLGAIYQFEENFKNLEIANQYFEEAAKLKHDVAAYNLGLNYMTGHGVRKDDEKAKYWFEQAILFGNKVAVTMLAQLKTNPTFYKRVA
jgi:hypothetical protein